jgi:hypothetical protein
MVKTPGFEKDPQEYTWFQTRAFQAPGRLMTSAVSARAK